MILKSEVLFKNTGHSPKICKVLAEYYDEKKNPKDWEEQVANK